MLFIPFLYTLLKLISFNWLFQCISLHYFSASAIVHCSEFEQNLPTSNFTRLSIFFMFTSIFIICMCTPVHYNLLNHLYNLVYKDTINLQNTFTINECQKGLRKCRKTHILKLKCYSFWTLK